jgi:hypothetical protein
VSEKDDIELLRQAYERNKIRKKPARFYSLHISIITTISILSAILSVFTASTTLLYQEDNLQILTADNGRIYRADKTSEIQVAVDNTIVINGGTRPAVISAMRLLYKEFNDMPSKLLDTCSPDEVANQATSRNVALDIAPVIVGSGQIATIVLLPKANVLEGVTTIQNDEIRGVSFPVSKKLTGGNWHMASTCINVSFATPNSSSEERLPITLFYLDVDPRQVLEQNYFSGRDVAVAGTKPRRIVDKRRTTIQWLNGFLDYF